MKRYIALLRGINVGGKHMLPMSKLVEMMSKAGCAEVRTYIQSGNVVFSATPQSARSIADVVSKKIAKAFGFQPAIILRSAEELRQVAAVNPFVKARGAAEESLHVAFLAEGPSKAAISALDPTRSPGDSFEVRGCEIYLYFPNGLARTKLTNAYFDSKLNTTSTMRNWRTVLKLVEMTQKDT